MTHTAKLMALLHAGFSVKLWTSLDGNRYFGRIETTWDNDIHDTYDHEVGDTVEQVIDKLYDWAKEML